MNVYNEEKTQVLTEYDLDLGYLKKDFIVHNIPEVQAVEGKGHWKVLKEYPKSGGRDVDWISEVDPVEYQPARTEEEEILIYVPYNAEELIEVKKHKLREWRSIYFEIIDRACWYDCLTDDEKKEVKQFRQHLKDITITLIKPEIPKCVANEIKEVEQDNDKVNEEM